MLKIVKQFGGTIMFGLEKENKDPLFEFDMEKDFKKDHGKKKQICKEVEDKIHDLKTLLRKGMESEEEFEKYGVLLRGYSSLQKVINRIGK